MSSFFNFFSGAQRATTTAQPSQPTLDQDEITAPELPMEETSVPKPQRGVKRKNALGTTVDIVVGSEDCVEKFEIHRSKLRKISHYFETALKQEPEAPSFLFANEEPEIFERIQNWIYENDFVLKQENPGHVEIGSTQNTQNVQDDEDDLIQPEPLRIGGCQNEHGEFVTKIAHGKPFPGRLDLDDEGNAFNDDNDNDEGAQEPERSDPPTPLDTLTLSKLYTLAEQLEMSELCNEVIKVLGKRLGYDSETPSHALVYAFQRSKTDSPLRELLVDYTARSAPIKDMLSDASFDTDDCTQELLLALVKKLGEVRGNICFTEAEWAEHFESTVDSYLVKVKSRK